MHISVIAAFSSTLSLFPSKGKDNEKNVLHLFVTRNCFEVRERGDGTVVNSRRQVYMIPTLSWLHRWTNVTLKPVIAVSQNLRSSMLRILIQPHVSLVINVLNKR